MAKMLAESLDNGMVRCLACNHFCRIKDGDAGFCGVRYNEAGKLKLMVHSRPCAVWSDPIEKKPLFHFLPGTRSYSLGTFGCNFSCEFCQNWDISQAPHELKQKDPKRWKEHFARLVATCNELTPQKVVENAIASGCSSISFTYNEPTIFTEYALDVMEIARKKDLKGVYVTNGYESRQCWDAIAGHIDAANIDLKAFNQKFYRQLCKVPSLDPVKDSIIYSRKKGIWVEITTLLIPGWNDDEKELEAAAAFLASIDPEMPWHVTAFHPDYKMLDTPPTQLKSLIRAREIGKKAGLKYVYCGNVPLSYSEYEKTNCPSCGKMLLSRVGMALAENNVIDSKCRFCFHRIAGIWE